MKPIAVPELFAGTIIGGTTGVKGHLRLRLLPEGTDAALRRMRRQGRLGRDEQSIRNRFFYDEAMAAIRPTGLPVAASSFCTMG